MPTYDYSCSNCGRSFEDIKGIKAYDADPSAACPNCSHVCGPSDRDFSNSKFTFIGTSVQSAEYNPGLGCIVKNKAHKENLLKAKGLHEVGNDFGTSEKMQTHFETKKKEERDRVWKNELGEV